MSTPVSTPGPSDKPLRLLQSVPGKVYSRLIVRYPHQTDKDYAFFYHEAAKRLATTYSGRPIDDTILLPFLMLYRHAFELQLKNFARYLAGLRRSYHETANSELEPAAVDEKLRHKLGHNLAKLLNELLKHYDTLSLDESFPDSVRIAIAMLHDADRTGTAFRYSGQLPQSQDNADFPALAALLDEALELLNAVEDWVDSIYSAGPHPQEEI